MAELCALFTTFVITVVIGGPIAAKLARIQVFRQPTLADARAERAPHRESYFEPLDFGPDNMRWPSEIERPDTRLPQPPWPSSTWDDDHFGKNSPPQTTTPVRVERQQAPAAAQRQPQRQPSPQQRVQQAQQQQPSQRKQQARAEARKRQAQQKQQQLARQQKRQQAQQRKQQEQAQQRARRQAARKQQQAPPPSAPEPAADASDAIERLVAERGLAGAVQFLMQQNGWDFRTAAAFLANNRKR